ncbi:alpha/beta fold hydrolase [Petrachloros mirabilis]
MHGLSNPTSAYFTTNDGVRLHYLDKGVGLPLILLPGWTQPASGFSEQIEELSDVFRCLALDFRGHGESERPEHGYRVSRLARDLGDFLDHLGLPEAMLLGHSAGSTVIWSFIDLFGQDRIRALVLCDEMAAFIRRPEWSEEECRRYGAVAGGDRALSLAASVAGPDGEQVMRDFLTREFSADFPKRDVARVIEGSLKMTRKAAAELMVSVMQADYRDVLPLIRRPTLCIGGTESHLGPEVMPWIASRIPGAKVAMIRGRHFVHLENPVEFNAAVRDFLEVVNSGAH